MKKVLILSHIPMRDEIVDNLIGNELSKDHMVWVASILQNPRQVICTVKPDIVLLPEIRLEFTRDLARYLQEWGVMGVTKETELTEELERCLFGNLEYEKYIDLDLCWGQCFADMVAEHGTPKEKIKVIGGIGFDPYFINPPEVKPYDNTRILFAGGFGYADKNAIYAVPEAKPGEKIHIDLVKADRNNRNTFARMMQKVMDAFPDFEYFVRPHPGEKYKFYQDTFGDKIRPLGNIHCRAAICSVGLVIHPGSTMAFECHLEGKPSLNYRNTNLDTLVGAIAPLFLDADSLIDEIRKLNWERSNADLNIINKLDPYYGKVDGKAHKRIANEIRQLKTTSTNIPNSWPKDDVKYLTQGVYAGLDARACSTCQNIAFTEPYRDTYKCPYCGIVCSKL